MLLVRPYPVAHAEHIEPSIEHFPTPQLTTLHGHGPLPEKLELAHLKQVLLIKPYPTIHAEHVAPS